MLSRIASTVVVGSVLTACVGEPQRFVFEPPTNGATPAYRLVVESEGMRYSFLRPTGEPEILAHPQSGVIFDGAPVVTGFYIEDESTEDRRVFRVENDDGRRGRVEFLLGPHTTSLKVVPDEPNGARIEARLGPIAGPAYGLADQGWSGDVSRIGELRVENDGGHDRFVSSFTIYPLQAFGQVLISQQRERLVGDTSSNVPHLVTLTATQTSLGIEGVAEVSAIVYFFGDPPTIYREFKTARTQAGYADVRPNARMFGVGWEAWPLLGWNTNAGTVQTSVQGFLDRGYPLSWVTVGSGFWEHGGTTTSFGRWNTDSEKYPEPTNFVQWFRDRDVALLLGLRTQFVDGLGINTGTGRDGDSGVYVDGVDPPPEYEHGIEAGMFATLRNEALFQSQSEIFPKWDSSLAVLDSTRKEPVDWFQQGTAKWGVDGWKEDTMLTGSARIYHDGHWNPIMATLHQSGDLVMARNAYVGSPGSLQRLNDTDGEEARIPQLALAYAASGVPNVYTDIVGNRQQNNVQYIERHAKLQATTAAIGLGVEPWRYDQNVADRILRAVRWHARYRPFFHSAALKSWRSGFPHTLTPLPIALPDDVFTHSLHERKMWQWMIDTNLLAHPLLDDGNTTWRKDVYLPSGEWIDVNTGERYAGPLTIADYDHSDIVVPIFVGGSGILVTESHVSGALIAEVWPVARTGGSTAYEFSHAAQSAPGEELTSTIVIVDEAPDPGAEERTTAVVTDVETGTRVAHVFGDFDVLQFPFEPGHDYRVIAPQPERRNDENPDRIEEEEH